MPTLPTDDPSPPRPPVATPADLPLRAMFAGGAVALTILAYLLQGVGGSRLQAGLGAIAARAGGAPVTPGAARVTFWGALAMGVTSAVGWFFGVMMT